MTGEYTQDLLSVLNYSVHRDYAKDCDFQELLDLVNSEDFIRPFSERLLDFYNHITQNDYSFGTNDAANDMIKRMKSKNIEVSVNTVKGWFKDKTPKYGDEGRENIYKIAFALELSVEDTTRLFNKVFLDTAFVLRNQNEAIYKYCLKNKKSFSDATKMISRIDRKSSKKSVDTIYIGKVVEECKDEEAVIDLICESADSFTKDNKTAVNKLSFYRKALESTDGREGLAEREYKSRSYSDDEKSEYRQLGSLSFVYDMIMNGSELINKTFESKERISSAFTRKEIVNQFPNVDNISTPKSSYVIRKDIILLFFYYYWVQAFLNKASEATNTGFISELNGVLDECGFSPLYAGNPYDWVILYCSACKDNDEDPLDVFRGLMDETYYDEDTVDY